MICASFSMFSQVLARGFPHLSQQVRQGRSFDASLSLTWQRLRSEVHKGEPPATSQNVKTWNIYAHLGTCYMTCWQSHQSRTVSNYAERYCIALNQYCMVSFLNRVILLWIWFEHGMNPHQIAEPLFRTNWSGCTQQKFAQRCWPTEAQSRRRIRTQGSQRFADPCGYDFWLSHVELRWAGCQFNEPL